MIRLTHHAVDQYVERVKPAMFRSDAHLELEALAENAEIVRTRPAWVTSRRSTMAWAIISDGIALTLRRCRENGDWVATTCITREGRQSSQRRRKAARLAREARLVPDSTRIAA